MPRLPRVLTALVPLLAAGLVVAACSTPTSAQMPATAAGTQARTTVTKLLVFVEENHSLDGMRAGMPYTYGLARTYGYATGYHALAHPSLPNYIGIAGGQMYGVHDDALPPSHRLTGRSVFGQALSHGTTAAVYADSMPVRCDRSNSGDYAPKHNPWTYFVHERTGCAAHDRGMAAFRTDVAAGHLPRVGMVVPNLCHDAHNCSLATADAWFKAQMTRIVNGPDWKSGHLAVVLTADEDDHTQGNKVLTVVLSPNVSHKVVSTPLTHYSLTRLYDEVAHLPYLHNAATAPSMARAFGLPVPAR